jgi:hypothetical protein
LGVQPYDVIMPTKTVKPRKQTGKPVPVPVLIPSDADAVVMYAALAREHEALRTAYQELLSHYQVVAYECEMYRSVAKK